MERRPRSSVTWVQMLVTSGFSLCVLFLVLKHISFSRCVSLGTIYRSNFCLLWTINQQQLRGIPSYLGKPGDEEETINQSELWTADTVGVKSLQFCMSWIKRLCFRFLLPDRLHGWMTDTFTSCWLLLYPCSYFISIFSALISLSWNQVGKQWNIIPKKGMTKYAPHQRDEFLRWSQPQHVMLLHSAKLKQTKGITSVCSTYFTELLIHRCVRTLPALSLSESQKATFKELNNLGVFGSQAAYWPGCWFLQCLLASTTILSSVQLILHSCRSAVWWRPDVEVARYASSCPSLLSLHSSFIICSAD